MDRNRNTLLKKSLSLAIILCALASPIFLNKNVLAYSVYGASMNYSQTNSYNSCTSRTGSKTVFGMSFYLDGEYINTSNCCCNNPGLPNFMTEEWGVNPFSWYNTGGYAYDSGSDVAVVFGASRSDLQSIVCFVNKPVVETQEPRSRIDNSEQTEYVRTDNFTVDASTELVSVNGASSRATNRSGLIMGSNDFCGNQLNYYEANSDKATVNFLHKLWHPDFNFNVNVSYTAGASRGSTTVQKNGVRSNVNGAETNVIPLSTSDSATQVCQNINYNAKNWSYRYVRQVYITKQCTWVDYYRNGVYSGSSSESCWETNRSYGSPYLDTSSLSGSGSGSTNNACAMIHRPWNFNITITDNTTSGDTGGETYNGKKILYVGDTITPKYKIDVTKNDNSFPITDIPNATITLCSGIKGRESCSNIYANKTIHEESGNVDSSTSYSYREKTNYSTYINGENVLVDDVPAGTEYCVEIRVTPINSGNGYNCGFNKGVVTSGECYFIAKKPIVQVWGGNIVSGKSIESSFTKKSHGIYGSWGELAVVAGGQITGFASGASLANGGVKDVANNKLIMLTLANSSLVSYLGGDFNTNLSKIRKDKEAVLEKIETSYEVLNVLPNSPVSGKKYVKVDGNLLIDRDIKYTEEATNLDNMPKLLIYAKGNINIHCNVSRIDAIIVADGIINTCTDSNGVTPERDAKIRSKQLVINGMVIANEIQFNRMYGAAAGDGECVSSRGDSDKCSAIPAEIINYDSLIELMTMEKVNEGKTGFNVVYTQESAVRY